MINANIYKKIQECTDPFELEKMKITIMYLQMEFLSEIAKKRLYYK